MRRTPRLHRAVAFVLKGYPRLSETFIAQEIQALEGCGFDIRIVSLRRPTDPFRHPVHEQVRAPVTYLPEYLHREPARVARGIRGAARLPGFTRARRAWLRDLRRDPTPNRVRRFGQALVLAHELPRDVVHLHAHFLHTPASVARYASLLTGRPWSGSAHAKDIWTTPAWEKREKLAECAWMATCTAANYRHLAALVAGGGGLELSYHGIDLDAFPPPREARRRRDGSEPRDPVVIASVGRAVEKKGYDDLLDALARLPPTRHWRFEHIGGGPMLDRLRRRARGLGLSDRIRWRGAQPRDEVLRLYRRADLFVLACRIAADGDRDGLPNVLMEAQSQAVACLSTRVSAVPELIVEEQTGVLVSPGDVPALAARLDQLLTDPARRERLGRAGQARVGARFSHHDGIARLAERFRSSLPAAALPGWGHSRPPPPPEARCGGEGGG